MVVLLCGGGLARFKAYGRFARSLPVCGAYGRRQIVLRIVRRQNRPCQNYVGTLRFVYRLLPYRITVKQQYGFLACVRRYGTFDKSFLARYIFTCGKEISERLGRTFRHTRPARRYRLRNRSVAYQLYKLGLQIG